jgi:hypothetical protein
MIFGPNRPSAQNILGQFVANTDWSANIIISVRETCTSRIYSKMAPFNSQSLPSKFSLQHARSSEFDVQLFIPSQPFPIPSPKRLKLTFKVQLGPGGMCVYKLATQPTRERKGCCPASRQFAHSRHRAGALQLRPLQRFAERSDMVATIRRAQR